LCRRSCPRKKERTGRRREEEEEEQENLVVEGWQGEEDDKQQEKEEEEEEEEEETRRALLDIYMHKRYVHILAPYCGRSADAEYFLKGRFECEKMQHAMNHFYFGHL
jgi:hypothetical protein